MANTPFGLLPRRRADGMTANFQMRHYTVPATDANSIGVGDLVVKVTGAADVNGVPAVTLATAGGRATGVVVGFTPSFLNVSNGAAAAKLRTPNTAATLIVCDDPDALYEIQDNSAGGTPLPVTAVGKNANIVYGAPNTYNGVSGTQLDTASVGTGAALNLNIVEFEQRADVQPGTTFQKVLVRINNHTEAPGAQAGI